MRTVEIVLPNHLPHGFDYAVPDGMSLSPGDYVVVPFGKREMPGVVWGPGTLATTGKTLKFVGAKLAHLPPMREEFRTFLEWVARYTVSPIGAVMKMTMPMNDALKLTTNRERNPFAGMQDLAPNLKALNEAQKDAATRLIASLRQGYSVTLLDGVTGSGKTEVYFEAMAHLLGIGDWGLGIREKESAQTEKENISNPQSPIPNPQILVLLPEIALSVQWLERFAARFGTEPYVWHSGLTPARRKHTWRAVANGTANVIVGARSALFLPYKNLRLIIVDEEHDGSYKQEEGVIYQARDMAVLRARHENIPAILASATPSLESVYNVSGHKYGCVCLAERHGSAQLPEIHTIDMRNTHTERGAFISTPLRETIAASIARGEQAMLFLNRRGYAPLVLCRTCGHRFQCPQCTAWLVMHKTLPRLLCHHCGFMLPSPDTCPECGNAETLTPIGPGVERIAEEARSIFPGARIAVMASDQTTQLSELQAVIDDMEHGLIDLLIGTQMVAKGHHFGKLTLVGVVDADLGLGGGDLRASERTFQLLQQLSGRAGREEKRGLVLLQSYLPVHPVMQALIKGDREAFLAAELNARERAAMPPFTRLAALIVESDDEAESLNIAKRLAAHAPRHDRMEVLGPAPAPLFKLRNLYRYRLLAKAARGLDLSKIMRDWVESCRLPRDARVKIDIDPYSFL